ncbi:hypothetical protein DSO57_1039586 [Entomophthora muscae]|uniref:Uncharacterized protein n=1 Tax=Entomophthora muscae TaxID=34485 RepID=A0ACC2U2R7_9FUNG|nr:hypothetical protein DSO57_1039586 [Entomophthora muscae]
MTKKGGAGFVRKGYSFSCNNKKKPIHKHNFKCDNVGCPARLTTYGFTHFKSLTIGHDCAKPFDPLYQLIHWFLCQVIPTTKDQTATEVVNNALINLNDTQLATVGGASKLQRYLTDQIYALSTEGVSATSIDQLVLTEEQKLSQHEEIFLLHNDGQHAPEQIICFATSQDLHNLLKCKTWLADGTFSTCPKLFSQLWNIHGQVGNLVFPLVFFFLPNKKQETYVRALTILNAKLDEILPTIEKEPKETRGCKKKAQSEEATPIKKKPESLPYHEYLVVYFEQAQANAFIRVFKSSPQGCYFHFWQALCRRLQKCSALHELIYTEGTKEAKDVFNCFAALALVQKEETNAFYDALLRHPYIIANQAAFAPFIEYFETQWVGVFQGAHHIRKGGDSIQWNCFKQVKDGLFKTTSSLEGWHSQFATRVQVQKPKFNKTTVHLKAQQAISACLFKTGIKTKDDPPKQTKVVKKYTEISKVVLAYYPKDSKIEHLQAISVALSTNV